MLKMIATLLRKKKDSTRRQKEVEKLIEVIDYNKLPQHIAIIMDGNGRWASQRGLPRSAGHRAGVEALRDVVEICSEINIKILTAYAFSTENWKRPQEEINVLMRLLVEYIHNETDELVQKNVRINPIGKWRELPVSATMALTTAVERTRKNNGLTLNLAINYGGRAEIVDAVKTIARDVLNQRLSIEQINEELISCCLHTTKQPDPDLLIRPSGDYRVSNFLLWQVAYTEFWFTPVPWPDFRRTDLLQAVIDFQRRERRFGGLLK